jgi:aspartyl-tRNA(Asn)/glutamyl-tRNA(Gln) amidotransferase subunit B
LAEKLIAENPTVVADFKAGKEASLQYLVGQAMKVTKGSANPQVIKKILLSVIG